MAEAKQQEIDEELEEIKRLLDNNDIANTKRTTKFCKFIIVVTSSMQFIYVLRK